MEDIKKLVESKFLLEIWELVYIIHLEHYQYLIEKYLWDLMLSSHVSFQGWGWNCYIQVKKTVSKEYFDSDKKFKEIKNNEIFGKICKMFLIHKKFCRSFLKFLTGYSYDFNKDYVKILSKQTYISSWFM